MAHNNPVYEPREDSFLLKEIVEQYAAGDLLEIGTGSGILARAAAGMSAVNKVVAVDLNPAAVLHAKKSLDSLSDAERKKVTVKKSNLFSNIKRKFDTIVFNPPYLPEEKGYKDMALDGGKKGHELVCRFMDEANKHLTQPGIILLLFSSLTGKEKVDEAIESNCLSSEILATRQMGMEELFVYKIEKSTLLRELEMKGVEDIRKFDRGKRGHIFTGYHKGQKVAIKSKNPSSGASESINNEIKVLDFLRNIGFGSIPDVILTGHNYFVYKFIEGQSLGDFIVSSETDEIRDVLCSILDICRALDKEGFSKEEMHRPHKHIFISDNQDVKMIDFERAHESDKPKNVTQFCQYLVSSRISGELSNKGLCLDVEKLRKLSADYKTKYSERTFQTIKKEL